MHDDALSQLKNEVENMLPKYGTHGFEHTSRVYFNCLHIGTVEKAELSILLPAALLHDIAREEENHAEAGSKIAKPILRKYCYSEDNISKITMIISTHSFSRRKPPETLEGKILSDADKIDALGAVGIYRTATFSGEHERPIEEFVAHFHEKLLKLEDLLFTAEAKRMAAGRTQYMRNFLNQLDRELSQKT